MLAGTVPALFDGGAVLGNDAFTKLLLHCDGANGSTVFTDASLTAKGNATVVGGAQVSTAQSKFGGASALFNGTTSFLTYPSHADFNFGAGELALDCQVRFNTLTADHVFISKWTTVAGKRSWMFMWQFSPMALRLSVTPDGTTQTHLTQPWTPTVGVWYHVAAVKDATGVYLFVDGVLLGAKIANTVNLMATTELVRIGAADNGSGTAILLMDGWLDELRVSNIARWTANFSPPAAPYS